MTLPFSSVGINTSVGYLSSVGSKAKYFIWRLLHGELSAPARAVFCMERRN